MIVSTGYEAVGAKRRSLPADLPVKTDGMSSVPRELTRRRWPFGRCGKQSVVLCVLLAALGSLHSLVRTRRELALENLALRQQLAILSRASPKMHTDPLAALRTD